MNCYLYKKKFRSLQKTALITALGLTLIKLTNPLLVYAQTPTPVDIGNKLTNSLGPIYFPYSSVGELISKILSAALTLASILFLLYFLLSAFRWLSAAGDKSKLESARQRMTNAFTGLVLVVATWAIFAIFVYILGLPVGT